MVRPPANFHGVKQETVQHAITTPAIPIPGKENRDSKRREIVCGRGSELPEGYKWSRLRGHAEHANGSGFGKVETG